MGFRLVLASTLLALVPAVASATPVGAPTTGRLVGEAMGSGDFNEPTKTRSVELRLDIPLLSHEEGRSTPVGGTARITFEGAAPVEAVVQSGTYDQTFHPALGMFVLRGADGHVYLTAMWDEVDAGPDQLWVRRCSLEDSLGSNVISQRCGLSSRDADAHPVHGDFSFGPLDIV